MRIRLIFLDFDGVLHPCVAGTFIYLERFQTFLRKHSELRVVFATTWRLDHHWQQLLALFDADLQERFIGITPDLSGIGSAQREREICTWLRANGYERAPWVALDDDASLFSPNLPQLVCCETIRGLRPAQLARIEEKLGLTSLA
jgi:hypothetical protein